PSDRVYLPGLMPALHRGCQGSVSCAGYLLLPPQRATERALQRLPETPPQRALSYWSLLCLFMFTSSLRDTPPLVSCFSFEQLKPLFLLCSVGHAACCFRHLLDHSRNGGVFHNQWCRRVLRILCRRIIARNLPR